MKFNHLLPRHLAEGHCPGTNKIHRWKPVQISATQGDYMNVNFICVNCKKRAGNFITRDQYVMHADKLERECEL